MYEKYKGIVWICYTKDIIENWNMHKNVQNIWSKILAIIFTGWTDLRPIKQIFYF